MHASYRFERTFRIRFGHCDPAGIVFFPQYLVMINALLEDWFNDALGIAYAELLGPRRIGTPTVHLECDFKAVSHFGDDVTLSLQVERLGNTSLILTFACHAADELRMQARQVLVFTDLNTHQAIAIPSDVRTPILACLTQAAQ